MSSVSSILHFIQVHTYDDYRIKRETPNWVLLNRSFAGGINMAARRGEHNSGFANFLPTANNLCNGSDDDDTIDLVRSEPVDYTQPSILSDSQYQKQSGVSHPG